MKTIMRFYYLWGVLTLSIYILCIMDVLTLNIAILITPIFTIILMLKKTFHTKQKNAVITICFCAIGMILIVKTGFNIASAIIGLLFLIDILVVDMNKNKFVDIYTTESKESCKPELNPSGWAIICSMTTCFIGVPMTIAWHMFMIIDFIIYASITPINYYDNNIKNYVIIKEITKDNISNFVKIEQIEMGYIKYKKKIY